MNAKSKQNKTVENDASVQLFLDSVQDPVRRADAETLVSLMTEVTGVQPKMWGNAIIGFGRNHYKYESGREGDQPAVGFSPRKANLSIYALSHTDTSRAALARLGKHKTSVACLYVNRLEQIDLEVLKELVKECFELYNEV
ncbi:DUF1801 domain-containing protein [Psychromicrobium lacuslunae]|uniref:YdhG-like domain-containing protein n=1 Tax=Psychromicrobium lacuslunae TaxID=1618207 RepID=A0A0D4C1P5_9MICC|nr:DUF1801 domain-containing protein [Psychromicrobium lacuslunae]AJT42286.1 hypothetical protein UM93_13720 [Psychromicrobium lacuslunae]